jgi:hypothetical protein
MFFSTFLFFLDDYSSKVTDRITISSTQFVPFAPLGFFILDERYSFIWSTSIFFSPLVFSSFFDDFEKNAENLNFFFSVLPELLSELNFLIFVCE